MHLIAMHREIVAASDRVVQAEALPLIAAAEIEVLSMTAVYPNQRENNEIVGLPAQWNRYNYLAI